MNFLRKIGILNLLLVFVPIALVMEWTHQPKLWIFVASCMAIIPLAGWMGKSTEAIAEHMGPGIGGLMNASFGNAAEMIIAVLALKEGYIEVVKASITGSILAIRTLVMGASFLAGGLRYSHQKFRVTAAGLSATLLALAAIGMLVPAFFHAHLVIHHTDADEQGVSLEIAIVLFSVYMLMLFFSLVTHKHLYGTSEQLANDDSSGATPIPAPAEKKSHHSPGFSVKTGVIILIAATTGVAIMAELLVGAIEETAHAIGWTELFVGVIVIAIVGNAAEHSTAILVALKNDMDLSFHIAVGSALQIALFVAPVLVFISYLPGFPQRLDLVFSMLEVVAVAVSVMIVGMVAYDGESNWMEGLLLLAVYVILGIAFYHLPETPAAAVPVSHP